MTADSVTDARDSGRFSVNAEPPTSNSEVTGEKPSGKQATEEIPDGFGAALTFKRKFELTLLRSLCFLWLPFHPPS